ncbi:Por secretion system C-terminal sorting domain-containing protein [Kaistella treverensis]|uniref:Por secretion system C-terminal sorting domain-containing protein n=1 Tax=Kaistella treverensis TaxID=631455 RepID=A0A1I3NLD0_9FLAO|nr:T9SS type A sorting domain-containing protein [Kaistella treverensis]SFJ09576.1 Por secretion system C-terminal sorting domain-containing protein [Kaistella treverensis]
MIKKQLFSIVPLFLGILTFSQTTTSAGCFTESVSKVYLNNFEGGIQNLPTTPTDYKVVSGWSKNANNVNSLDLRLFAKGGNNTDFPLYSSDVSSWYINNGSKTVSFGPLNVSNATARKISFNLAAFGSTEKTLFTNADQVTLEVRKPGTTTWSSEVVIKGNGVSDNDGSRYHFSIGATATETYDGDNVPLIKIGNFNLIELSLPNSTNFNNLDFRITAINTSSEKYWLIDNVKVTGSFIEPVTKTYTSAGWINAAGVSTTAPTINEKAIIAGVFTGDLTACECEVQSTGSVVVGAGKIVKLNHKLVNNGSFTVESDGNFIQVDNNAANSGNIVVKRNSPMQKNDYTYWSSPVIGQELKGFSPKTNSTRFYKYDEAKNLFVTVPSVGVNFVPARGYAIMAPSDYTTTLQTFEGVFTGIPNNGVVTSPVTYSGSVDQGYNLVGNPYSSNIDFEQLYTLNADTIEKSAYFWTNVDRNRQGSTNGNSNYSGNAYAIYNGTGGIPATNGGAKPTQFIKVGQGFIVKAKKAIDLVFNNSVRNGKDESIFFSKNATSAKDRFWMTLTSPSNNVNTVLIGYIPNATNDFELDFDAPLLKIGSDSFYSILGEEKLGIQGRSYPLNKEDVIAIGTTHFETGVYTIGLDDKEGTFAKGQNIYLRDKETKIITNLIDGNYTFKASAGEYSNRFEIVFTATALGVGSAVKAETQLYREGQYFVLVSTKKITGFELYDMSGRIIITQKPDVKEIRFNADALLNGTYILNAQLEGGGRFSKKLLK